MILIEILSCIIGAIVLLISAYLLIVTFASYTFRKKTVAGGKLNKFVVLIPAHNEELVIHHTLESFKKLNYPQDHVKPVVLADNCDDKTAEIARAFGVDVVERQDTDHRGKAYAINYFIDHYAAMLDGYDAITIVDADTLVDTDYFRHISESLNHEEVAIAQGYYGISNPKMGWMTAFMDAAFSVFNHVRPAGRIALGGSMSLKGNGMTFKKAAFLKAHGPVNAITQDLELTIKLLTESGLTVDYNPQAVVYAEAPNSAKAADSQRSRWEVGRLYTFERWSKKLWDRYTASLEFKYLDAIIDLMIPPLAMVVMLQLLFLILSLITQERLLIIGAVSSVSVTVLYVVSGMIMRRCSWYTWLNILKLPYFLVWKLGIYIKLMLSKRLTEFTRTKRNLEVRQH